MIRQSMREYAQTYRSFTWQVPPTFNFGADVVDRWAEDSNRLALIWVNEAGAERRFTFTEIAPASNRFANLLADSHKNNNAKIMGQAVRHAPAANRVHYERRLVRLTAIDRSLARRYRPAGRKKGVCFSYPRAALATSLGAPKLDRVNVAFGSRPAIQATKTALGRPSPL